MIPLRINKALEEEEKNKPDNLEADDEEPKEEEVEKDEGVEDIDNEDVDEAKDEKEEESNEPVRVTFLFVVWNRIHKLAKSFVKESQKASDAIEDQPVVEKREVEREEKFYLPWIFMILGWGLCILCILVSIFFLWAYAVQFGNDKTYQWLSSLIVAFFSGLLLLEPIKVENVTTKIRVTQIKL